MAHLQNWGCPIFLQRRTDLYSFQLLQLPSNLFFLFVFQIRKQISLSDQLGILICSNCYGKYILDVLSQSPFFVLFFRGPLKVFHWHKSLFGFISMPSCHPIASLWPHSKLWHLEPHGGHVWPIYRTVSNVPVGIFRALTCFKARLSLIGFKRWKGLLLFCYIGFQSKSHFISLLSIPRGYCQDSSAQKDNCK